MNDFIKDYPQYAPIANHIRAAGLERTVVIAQGIAEFIGDCWNAIKQPAPPPAITPIDRRKTVRHDAPRTVTGFVHR
jgi:hypothetical protein